MKSKKKRSNDAVAEVIGTVLMLGMAISLIAMVYISVLSYPFTPSTISADLIGSVDGNSIIIEHHGGDSLSLSTEIMITVGGSATRITVEDYLDDESKADGLWNIGEQVVYSDETLTNLQVKVAVVDTKSNSAILMGVLQDGTTITTPALDTSVDSISPYEITFSPLTTTATGDSGLDNVTLYYRWSDDNVSWGECISGETNDTVDSNTTDVDSSADKGMETNFANAQDTSPDSDFMNIQENFTGVSAVDEWLFVDSGSSLTLLQWQTESGSSPYIDADDASYIHEDKTASMEEGWFDFDNTAETGVGYTVNFSFLCYGDDNDDGWDIYYDTDGDESAEGSISFTCTQTGSYAWLTSDDLPGTYTATQINAMKIMLDTTNGGGGDDRYIDACRMGINRTASTNYEIDFEYNWSNADFDKENEEICFYVDSHNGSENLNVNYWSGSSWSSLGSITGTGWTNLTATGLTSSTYTIQLIGATESSDTSQDDWNIDVISLHTWNSTQGVNWGIWSDPDTGSPWSWDFDFPNGSGYYEFYSIGRYNGDVEAAPGSADAICKY
jgi:hypothetical protein